MKLPLLVILTFIPSFVLAQSTTNAQPAAFSTNPPAATAPPQARPRLLDILTSKLRLTDVQQTQITPVLVSRDEKMKAIRENTSLTDDQKHEQTRALMESINQQIESFLTPAQVQAFDELRQSAGPRAVPSASPATPASPAAGPQPATTPVNTADWSALVPITEMTAKYKGEDGGLYGSGRNVPPPAHLAAYLKESGKIQPLDAKGRPLKDGKIGLITIGFSNTNLESMAFKNAADADPQKSGQVVIVNGAIGGRSAVMWAWDGADVLPKSEQQRLDTEMDVVQMPKTNRKSSPGLDKDTWPTLAGRIQEAGLSPDQVQAVWLKEVEANPKPLGDFPAHARALQADMTAILIIARHYYPHLRVAYLSSRTFGGWSGRESGSPEPYAYESGFGTRWVVQSQIKGDANLNYDPARGAVKAPLVIWGPYLWAQGNTPRKLDGMVWSENDVRSDRLHPNGLGLEKTTALLMNFFKTDAGTSRWFLKPGEKPNLLPLPKE